MALPGFLANFAKGFSKEPTVLKNFVALRISAHFVSAGCWEVKSGKVEVGKIETVPVSENTKEGLLFALDKAISGASLGITPEPTETLLGIPASWVEDGKIKEPHLSKLRNICRELDLKPLGFVILPEALANYYHNTESVPLTAILVGLDGEELTVSLLRAGKIVQMEITPLASGEDPNEAIEKVLKKFVGVEILPSRIIVYDGAASLDNLKEQILSHPWTQKLPFLHFPKVEVVDSEVAGRSVAFAGGTQMGGKIEEGNAPAVAEKPVHGEIIAPKTEPAGPKGEDLGFFKDQDVAVKPEETVEKPVAADQNLVLPDLSVPETAEPVNLQEKPAGKFPLAPVLGIMQNLRIPKFSLTRAQGVPILGIFLGLVASLLLLAGGGYALAGYVTSAKVTVFVSSKVLEPGNRDVVVVTGGAVTDENSQIAGSTVEVDETSTKKGVATGRQLVGTKAKGTVTIISSSNVERTLPAGTAITANGLKFLTDNSVDVASAAGIASPSTATVTVTASGIGDSYNLSSGTIFSVGEFPNSTYQGKNDQSFSGGSSHEASVVAQSDQDRLVATLSAELMGKSVSDLKNKLTASQNLVDNAVTSSISKKTFDHGVGDEASSLNLTLGMHFTGVLFDQSQLIDLLSKQSASQIPDGYELDKSVSTADVVNTAKDKAGNFILTVHFRGQMVPKINKSAVISTLAGKNLTVAKNYLGALTGVQESSIIIQPNFLAGISGMPKDQKKISFEVVTR